MVPALLSLIKGAEGLVDGKGLRVKGLLVGAQGVPVFGPPFLGPPGARRPHPAVVLARAAGPDSVPAVPLVSGLEGRCPLLEDDLAGEAARCAPLLRLCCLIPADGTQTTNRA